MSAVNVIDDAIARIDRHGFAGRHYGADGVGCFIGTMLMASGIDTGYKEPAEIRHMAREQPDVSVALAALDEIAQERGAYAFALGDDEHVAGRFSPAEHWAHQINRDADAARDAFAQARARVEELVPA